MNLTRRRFLRHTSLTTASAFALPRFAIGQAGVPASRRLNLAFIGGGGIAEWAFTACTDENYVAICDVDDARAAKWRAEYPAAKRFKDFRAMLDHMHREIDAVIISIPDHTHFAAAYLAMQAGKAVYVQKPLTHDLWQARTLQRAAHHFKVVTQMGNQGHATEGIRLVKEWYEAGALGAVSEVHAWVNGPKFDAQSYFKLPAAFPPPAAPVPASLDWDLWLGPARARDYADCYHARYWRGWWDFGGGKLGDWACHTLDAPFWALGLGAPERVAVLSLDPIHESFVPRASHLRFDFPARGAQPPVAVHWYEGAKPAPPPHWDTAKPLPGEGMLMVGDKATLLTGHRPDSPRLAPDALWEDFRRNLPAKTIPRVLGGPFLEWTRAVKGEGPAPGSQFDYSARLTEMSLVGQLAQRARRDIAWDSAALRVSNHRDLDHLVREPARAGWDFGAEVWRAPSRS
jgi:predicted dehydrogenase